MQIFLSINSVKQVCKNKARLEIIKQLMTYVRQMISECFSGDGLEKAAEH